MWHRKAIIFKIISTNVTNNLHITKIPNTKYNFVRVYPHRKLVVSHYIRITEEFQYLDTLDSPKKTTLKNDHNWFYFPTQSTPFFNLF